MVMCRFNDNLPAAARFSTPYGCVCYPDDCEQDLCIQHIIKWGIIGSDWKLTIEYLPLLLIQHGWR